MRLNQIRDLLAVVDSGSIRAAARKLGLSQPTLSKSIRGLEAELHVQLVERTTRGVVPTAYGRLFAVRARVAQTELRKAGEELAQLAGGRVATVAFGAGPVAALMIVPLALASFRAQHPGGRVRIMEGLPPALLPLVRDATLDFAITRRPESEIDPALRYRPLVSDGLVVVARKGHRLAGARSLAQLVTADWLSLPYNEPRAVVDARFAQTFASAGVPVPRPAIECDSYTTILGLLGTSDMLAIIPRRLLESRLVAHEPLKEIPVSETLPSFTIGLYTRADAPLTSAAAAMAKAVTKVVRERARRN